MIRQTHRPRSGRQFYLATAMTALFAWAGQADALPTGFQLTAGTVANPSITGQDMTISQSSNRAVINWGSFNIASDEQVTFNQPNKAAITFNVVAPTSFTTISGQLSANGGLWLFSPAGILFGAGSKVSAGSFLASTGVFNSTSQSEAMSGANTIDIFPQATPGQGSITVQAAQNEGCMTLPAADIDANAGFVLLHSPTIDQDGSVTASDAVVYNADESVTVQFLPATDDSNISLLNETSPSSPTTTSRIDHDGSTTAGTWFEADVAADVTQPGFGIINLAGEVQANGMKATGNPSDPTNGYSVILDGESTGATSGPVTSTIVSSNGCTTGSISAASGIFARAGTITTGAWANDAGAVTLQAANAVTIPEYTALTNASGPINIDPNGPVDVEGQINSGTSVFIAATQVILGANGAIGAGPAGTEGPGSISTSSDTATVTLQNYATNGDTPVAPGTTGGSIMIGAPLTWATDNSGTLTLNAYNALVIGAPITASADTAQVVINTGLDGNNGGYSFVNGGSLSFTGTPDSGQGLSINDTTYTLIFNQADLLGINTGPVDGNGNLNGDYALAVPLDFAAGGTATVFTGAPVAPTVYSTFNGTFLGLGNTISNLNIQDVTPIGQFTPNGGGTNGAIGLFGFVGPSGLVRDVNLSNASISGGDGIQAGALVGNLQGTVMNVTSSGQVTVGDGTNTTNGEDFNGDSASAFAGGLVGFSNGQIINGSSSATVTAGEVSEPSNGFAGSVFAGGLVGQVVGGGPIAIANSSASGAVAVGDNTGAAPVAGGLIGGTFGAGAITGSSATGLVTGGDGAIVGGFAGEFDYTSPVSGSFATGAVNGGAGSQAGGFAGFVDDSSITTSYATGAVTQTVGGSNGASNFAGGFVGLMQNGSSITQSYSSGAVQAAGGADASSYTYAGGFAGEVDDSTISEGYSLGAVTLVGATQAPATFGDFGGFAGVVQDSGGIDHVYATGLVSGAGLNTGQSAGLVGLLGDTNDAAASDTLSDSYWDETTTGQSAGWNLAPPAIVGGMSSGKATLVSAIDVGNTLSPYATATYTANFGTDLTTGAGTWVMIPGETRPMLSSEYSTTITSAHQLQLMALNPGANYTVANDIDASETTSASGVWNPANGFVPVGGNGQTPFTGVFDGQGHTISGLSITFTTADPQSPAPSLTTDGTVGLFGVVGPTGVLENVDLANAKVTGGDGMLVGALAGASFGSVNNASSSGVIKVGNEIETGTGITANAGGLIGGSGGSVNNSSSSASVTGGDAFAGGLVGTEGGGATISNSFATGPVVVGDYTPGGFDNPSAGGLIGEYSNGSSVSGSYATGSVSGGAQARVGGLIGSIDGGSVMTSYATGAVSGGAGSSVGGFAGVLNDSVATFDYATGSVTQTAPGAASANLAGGFVGQATGGSSISQSYASGAVNTVGGASAGQTTDAGGFVGDIDLSSEISDSYSLGAAAATGSAFSDVGGFAGIVQVNAAVSGFYATGHVTGSGTTGGLVAVVGDGNASDTASISDGYWDEGTTGQTVTGYTLLGTGTTATNIIGIGGSTGFSPYATSTYANFGTDLTTGAGTWVMIPGETRPMLSSEYSTTITNAHQLQLMDLNLAANYTLGNNINAAATGGASDIWNPATGFSPIGATASKPFTGTFDGQGHTISNLTVIDTTTVHQTGSSGQASDGAAGLFGFVVSNGQSSGILENVILANANVSGGDGMEVGALAGDIAGTVTDASSSGHVSVGDEDSEFDAPARAGGLVGDLTGSIQNSSSSAIVTGGQANIGGLVGQVEGSVSGSFATGAVNGGGDFIAGGFVGLVSGTITTSYATADVTQTASVEEGDIAGGFAGEISGGQVSQSFSSGAVNVAGSETTPAFVGGFVGALENDGAVNDAYSTSPVTVSQSSFDNVGGFAGEIFDTSSATNVLATGAVSATGHVGGLVGSLDEEASITNGYWDEGTTNQTNDIGSADGTVINTVGMGGTTGVSPFDPATYFVAPGPGVTPGFNFQTTWSIPSSVDGVNFYPQLYGVSHVINITALPATSVYGNYPIYELAVTGLQGGDTVASAIQGYQVQALDAPTSSTSGYYNVNVIPPDYDSPYDLSVSNIAASGATGAYRPIYNDNVNNVDGGLSVTQAQLTLYSGGDDKTYDGTENDPNPQLGYSGLVPGDSASITAHFAQSDVGDEIPVIIDGYSVNDGNEGANYAVTTVNGTGEIDAESIVISAVGDTKQYDGTTNSDQTPTVSGQFYNGDGVTGLTQSFTSKDVMGTDGSTLVVNNDYTLSIADSADYNITFASAQGTITPAPLTINAVGDSKQYDGGTTSVGVPTYDPDQVLGTDTVTNLSQAFQSKDVMGTNGSTLVVNGYTINDGNNGNDYTVTLNTAQGTITPAPLTINAVTDSKQYDGGTTSVGVPTYDPEQVLGTDTVTNLSQAFVSKDVMGTNGSTLVVNGYTINDGNNGNDYTVTLNTAQGTITPAPLIINAVTDTKQYDGGTSSVGVPTADTLGTDTLTATQAFDSKDVMGTNGSTLAVTSYTINDGNNGNDYTVTQVNTAQGTITPAPLTINAVTDTKQYDGGTTSVGVPTYDPDQVLGTDTVSGLSQAFQSKDVMGTNGSTLVVNGYTINDGNNGDDYTVTLNTAQGTITPAPLTINAVGDSKQYDGGTTSVGVPTYDPEQVLGTDTVTNLSQAFQSKDVMGTNGSTLVVNGYTINDGNNGNDYTVTLNTAQGTITPAPLIINAVTDTKQYDGGTSSVGAPTADTLGTDTLTATQAFDSKDVMGTNGSTLAVTSYTINDGNNGNDYTVTQVNTAQGTITPAPLTINAVTDTKQYDGGTTSVGVPTYDPDQVLGTDTVTNLSQAFQSKDVMGTNGSTLVVNGYTINDGNNGADYTVTLNTAQGTITPAPLTINAVGDSKQYDGGTTSVGVPTYDPDQVLGTDTVSGLSQAFVSKDVMGTNGSTLVVNGYTINDGNNGADYTVTLNTAQGTITPAPLTINAVTDSKQYDGGTTSVGVPTYDPEQVLGTDTVTNLSQAFQSKDVMGTNGSTLVVNGYTINDGNNGNDYTVTLNTAQGTITPAPLIINAVTDTKQYDGGTSSVGVPTADTLGTDTLTATQAFDSKDVMGTNGSTLAVTSYTINDGNNGNDYTVTQVNTAQGTITPAPLTINAVTDTKQYDGGTTSVGVPTYDPEQVLGTDTVTNLSQAFQSKDVMGTNGSTLVVNGYTINDGNNGNDYTVTLNTAQGTITPAPLTLTAVTDTKTYDGGVTSSGTPTNSALIEGDTISDVTQSFASKNVLGANGSTLLVTGYTIDDGNDGNNYAVTLVSAPGTINPAPLTIAAVTAAKTYDGTTASSATPTVATLLGGDTITGLSETYGGKDAGAQTLSVAGYTINDGNDGNNYTVTTTTAAGEIDPKTLDVVLIGNVQKAYDGNTNATLTAGNYDLVGVISGDQVSLNDPTSGAYDTPAAGTHKLVTVGGLALSGADEANYVVDATADGQIGTITAPPQTLQIVVPTQDVTTLGFLSSATDAAAAVQNVITTTTTVVNVFPVGNDNDNRAQGDNLPITGTGNRDLWTSSEDTDQPCPPNPPTPCPPIGGSH